MGQWYLSDGFPNSANHSTAWLATTPNASSTRKHCIYEMVRAIRTMSYETDIETASSPSSISNPNHPNFQATPHTSVTNTEEKNDTSTLNLINETLTPLSTSNTTPAPTMNPPTSLCRPPPTPLFHTASTVWRGRVEAIVKNVEQTTDSAGHTSFLYKLIIPGGFTRTVQEACLETSAPPAPPPHATIPTPYPPVHVPDVAPSMTPTYLLPLPAQMQPPVTPTPLTLPPSPLFTHHPTLPQTTPPALRPPVPSPKPFEQTIL